MNPSSPLDGTGSKKKRSPEPKKKTKGRRKPRQNEPQKPVSAYALFFRYVTVRGRSFYETLYTIIFLNSIF